MDQLNEDLANAPQTVRKTFDAIKDQYDPWKPFLKVYWKNITLSNYAKNEDESWTERCTILDRRMKNGRQEQKEICAIVCPKLNYRELGV